MKVVLTSVFVLALLCTIVKGNDENKLVKTLLSNYERFGGRFARGVATPSSILNVSHSLSIQDIEIDIAKGMMILYVWENLHWEDINLSWSPKNYGGVDVVRIPITQIFVPDIMLFNAEAPPQPIYNTQAVVRNNGVIMWVPPTKYFSTCNIPGRVARGTDISCQVKFGSWTYDGRQLDLHPAHATADYDYATTLDNEWRFLEATSRRNVVKYDCCSEPYVDVTYTIKLRKL